MNKVLTLAAVMCMGTASMAFSADDMMQDSKSTAKQEMKTQAQKPMNQEMEKGMETVSDSSKEMKVQPKDAMAAKEMNPSEKMPSQRMYKEITASDLKTMMDNSEEFVLIDARDKKMFDKGHIEGAMNLPPEKITKAEMSKIAKSMDAKLVFYCGDSSCPLSKNAAEAAAKLGYKNVYKVPGGYAEWTKEGYKTTNM